MPWGWSLLLATAGLYSVASYLIAEWEWESISKRTADALRAKARRGERYGAIAYGWQVAANGTMLEPHPAEAALIALAAEHRFELRCSWLDTADALNRAGYRTRAGTAWTLHGIRSALLTWQRHQPG